MAKYVVSDDPKNRKGTVPIRGLAEARKLAYRAVTESRPMNGTVYIFTYPGDRIVGGVMKTKTMVDDEILEAVTYSYFSVEKSSIVEYVLKRDGTLGKFVGQYRS